MATSKNSDDKGKSDAKKGESKKPVKAEETSQEAFGDKVRGSAATSSLMTLVRASAPSFRTPWIPCWVYRARKR